jgi:hypothetical protein
MALIGGALFLLLIYALKLYPDEELLTFGAPLLIFFAFAVGFKQQKK